MYVSEVHFNHDPLTLTGDAMTIRQNYSEGRIAAPEWVRGLPPKPAGVRVWAFGKHDHDQGQVRRRASG